MNKKLTISIKAKTSLKSIFKYSARKWGIQTAKRYTGDINKAIKAIANDELILKKNPEFSSKYEYYTINSHYIFCEISLKGVLIVDILHTRMNIADKL